MKQPIHGQILHVIYCRKGGIGAKEDEDQNKHHEDDNDDKQIVASGDVGTSEKDSKSLNRIFKHSNLINHRVIHRVAH